MNVHPCLHEALWFFYFCSHCLRKAIRFVYFCFSTLLYTVLFLLIQLVGCTPNVNEVNGSKGISRAIPYETPREACTCPTSNFIIQLKLHYHKISIHIEKLNASSISSDLSFQNCFFLKSS